MKIVYRIVSCFVLLCRGLTYAVAQPGSVQPMRWAFTPVPLGAGEARLIFTACLGDGLKLRAGPERFKGK